MARKKTSKGKGNICMLDNIKKVCRKFGKNSRKCMTIKKRCK